jgi:hypothetical protein|tara:strand:+ start:328 stop:543 length:216 start_codon:yes stop_codon:yes gene_type:complete
MSSGTVLIRVEDNYGTPSAYPANENGRLFCAMTGCLTLRPSDLKRVQALGFEVVIERRDDAEVLESLGVAS